MRSAGERDWPIRELRPIDDAASTEPPSLSRWPGTIPAVAQLLKDGLELGRATVLVGANGSGKSTLVEAIAMAFGLGAEGGSTGARNVTRASESSLHERLDVVRNAGASRWGYFVRAETTHSLYSYLEKNSSRSRSRPEPEFHAMSHGESVLELIADRFRGPGLYVLDEPESGLSFEGALALVAHLVALLGRGGSQVVLATHSPILASLPGAKILEVGDWGWRKRSWDDLELVAQWRTYLDAPQRFLRHLT